MVFRIYRPTLPIKADIEAHLIETSAFGVRKFNVKSIKK